MATAVRPLTDIEGQTVRVTAIRITTGPLRDNAAAPLAYVELDDGRVFGTWDITLIRDLADVPVAALPGMTIFRRIVTDTNRIRWMME